MLMVSNSQYIGLLGCLGLGLEGQVLGLGLYGQVLGLGLGLEGLVLVNISGVTLLTLGHGGHHSTSVFGLSEIKVVKNQ